MSKELTAWQWIKDKAYRYLAIIFSFISMLLILVPATNWFCIHPDIASLIQKIGFVALTSGVFAVVLKSIQFTGVFREELEKVMLSTEFLKNRKDLHKLWKDVSNQIYSNKFPKIAELIHNQILETYMPAESHYNEDVVVTIIINELTDDMVVHYTETMEHYAVLESAKKGSTYKFKSKLSDDLGLEEINELVSLQINGIELANTLPRREETINGFKQYTVTSPLIGSEKIKVLKKIEQKHSLKGENYKIINFGCIIKNIDILISYPEDVQVSFFPIGIIKDFEDTNRDMKNCISKRLRDSLIYPMQGFGISFNKK